MLKENFCTFFRNPECFSFPTIYKKLFCEFSKFKVESIDFKSSFPGGYGNFATTYETINLDSN